MRRYTVSVAALMSAIVVFALGFAALHAATIMWAQAISWLVAMTLAAATSGALFTHGNMRAFCGGAALFGWQFVAIRLVPGYFGFTAYLPDPGYSLPGEIATVFHPLRESPTQPANDAAHFDYERQVWLIDAGAKKAVSTEIARGLLTLAYAVAGGIITLGLVRVSSGRSTKSAPALNPEASKTP